MQLSDRATEDNAPLRAGEEFSSLMDATTDCVKVLDLDGRVLHMNTPGLCAMEIDDFGTVSGRPWEALWPADRRGDIQRSVSAAAGGDPSSFQAYCPTAKGTPKWWDVTVCPVPEADSGRVVRLLAVSHDITQRRQVEERLRASEAEFRAAFEQSVVGAVQISIQTRRFVRVSAKFCELTGYSAEELASMSPADLTVAADRDADHQALERMLRGEVATYDREKRYVRKDGSIIWVHANGTLLRDGDGRPERTHGVVLDITARKRTEDRLKMAVDLGRLGVIQIDYATQSCTLDEAAAEMFGLQAGVPVPRSEVHARFHPDDRAEIERQTNACLDPAGAGSFNMEHRVVRPDGSVRCLNVKKQVLFSYVAGVRRPQMAVLAATDITDRKYAEEILRASEDRFRSLTTTMPQLVWSCSSEGVCTFQGPQWEAATGQSCADSLGCGWLEMIHPDDRERTRVKWEKAVAESRRYDEEYRLRTREGGYRWYIARAELLKDLPNGVQHWIGTCTDIEDAKRAAALVKENEQRMRLATEATAVGIWEWNIFTNRVLWDAQTFRIYGIPPTADGFVQYSDWSGAVLPEELQEFERVLQDTLRTGVQSRSEFRILRRTDGECRDIENVESVRFNAEGQAEWVLGTSLDVTSRKRAQVQLLKLASDLSEADRRKDEFLATLAHELRNPLAPIRNGLHVMKMASATPVMVERARSMMERQLAQMVRLVDDLMEVSRIGQGKLELRKERVDLTTVLNSAVETSRPLIEQMGHQLSVTLPEQPLRVEADLTRLAQVFLNLLNNAAKYSNRNGHIRLEAHLEGSDAVVTVTDTGIGIDADQLTHIFAVFAQIGGSLERSLGGLGIGLSLVKRLVEMHGGSVEAKSEGRGRGSQFIVRLPVVA